MANVATSVNPEKAHQIMAEGKGVIFFCGHQANWELLFLEGTSQMPGIAIGRPIKNRYLYAWVQKMRQKFGGTIVEPKHAIRAGLTALKRGAFVGIVGDQGMPDSGFASPFFGRRAYTSPMPALLAYKTQTPIIVATTHRKGGHYYITYSDPLYPDPQAPKGPEVRRLMDGGLSLLEASIRAHPGQWLWIHNRWKQQTTDRIKRPYRQDIIACFVPNQPALIADLPLLRVLYPTEHITVFAPKGYAIDVADELHSYTDLAQTLLDDLRFKLIINLTGNTKIDRHYRTTAETILSVATFQQVKRKVLGA